MTNSQEKDHWSSDAYQKAAGFVPKLATKIVQWLDVQPDDDILDIGCGDGILTCHIAQSLTTGSILGIDSSPSMIASAQQHQQRTLPDTQPPHCHFLHLNARLLPTTTTTQHSLPLPPHGPSKVFSNAALHWILGGPSATHHSDVLKAVHDLLRPNGVFVFEMGGADNVANIRAALIAATAARVGQAAAQAADPWFFPDEAWMRAALRAQGFVVERMELEERPTPVQQGEGGGLEGWVRLMGSAFLDVVGEEGDGEREACVAEVVHRLEEECRVEGGGYVMNYVRLRALARKVLVMKGKEFANSEKGDTEDMGSIRKLSASPLNALWVWNELDSSTSLLRLWQRRTKAGAALLPQSHINISTTTSKESLQFYCGAAAPAVRHLEEKMWDQIEATAPHLTYMILSSFLVLYALFSQFIRNSLHLSEPPLAVLLGIILGPAVLNVITPRLWGLDDGVLQEVTRIIVGVQCFAVGIELPKLYFHRHWRSVAVLLGPVMAFGWVVTSMFAYWVFQTTIPTAMIIGACLSPTDPVLAASVLAKSRFSDRIPKRIRNLLAAESGCNDGVSFPFLYAGLVIYTQSTAAESIKDWFLITILWQCVFGIILGFFIGQVANKTLRFCEDREYIGGASFIVFYLLLAIFSIGVGSTLGSDDFLVAFGAGIGFANDGWFAAKTKTARFPVIIDLLLNSTMFVYFGADIPWDHFTPRDITPHLGVWQLFLFLVLVLLFRRIPIMLAVKRIVPDIRTWHEALFCGHFGPMGLGALFLAMESRAQLETGTSLPLPVPPEHKPPYSERARAVELIWPVICFIVLGSTMVHGLSVAAISIGGHYSRKEGERAPLIGAETEALGGMDHESDEGDSDLNISEEESR